MGSKAAEGTRPMTDFRLDPRGLDTDGPWDGTGRMRVGGTEPRDCGLTHSRCTRKSLPPPIKIKVSLRHAGSPIGLYPPIREAK